MKPYLRLTIYTCVLMSSMVLLVGCGTVVPTAKPTFTPAPSPTATVTIVPTDTPTSTPEPPLAVLLAASGADQAQVSSLQTTLNDVVSSAGLRWQVRQNMTKTDLVPGLRLVVVLPPDPGLSELVASAPNTQFLALGITSIAAAPNLTVIGGEGTRPDQQGFIAGVIAAMLSADWRVGVISVSDTVEGRSARTGFLNGVVYFCGLCRPVHPPFYEYPLYIELASTATSAEWREAANYMVDHLAQTVYVFPGAGDETMLTILADAKVNIISSGDPPASVSISWVVSLSTDPLSLIKSEVDGLLNGSLMGGQSLAIPIQFSQINPALFSPGKQNYAQQVLSDLLNDRIDTGVDLTTGENRP